MHDPLVVAHCVGAAVAAADGDARHRRRDPPRAPRLLRPLGLHLQGVDAQVQWRLVITMFGSSNPRLWAAVAVLCAADAPRRSLLPL